MKQINEKQPKALIDKLRFLYNQLIFDTKIIIDGPAGSYGMARQVKTLSKRNEITLLRELVQSYTELVKEEKRQNEQFRAECRELIEQVNLGL